MGRQLIKVSPDQDLYVEWSSIVDAPICWGDRAYLTEYLMRDYRPESTERWDFEHSQVDKRFDRADETGSSAYRPFGCTWDDEGEQYMNQGTLPRGKLLELLERLTLDEHADVRDLLIPFEDRVVRG